MKTTLLAVALLHLVLFCGPAAACKPFPGTAAEFDALVKEIDLNARRGASALKAQADHIFVGRLRAMSPRPPASGQWSATTRITFRQTFALSENIKGTDVSGQPLILLIDAANSPNDCASEYGAQRVPERQDIGDAFLVYVKGKRILRTNRLAGDLTPFHAKEEIDFLRQP